MVVLEHLDNIQLKLVKNLQSPVIQQVVAEEEVPDIHLVPVDQLQEEHMDMEATAVVVPVEVTNLPAHLVVVEMR